MDKDCKGGTGMAANKRRSAFNTRQYMLSKDFEVFYYSDLNFGSVGSHSHDYYEIYFFSGGDVMMDISGSLHRLTPGDLIIIPPGVMHRAVISDGTVPYRRFVFWISRDYFSELAGRSEDFVYALRRAERIGGGVFHFNIAASNVMHSKLFALLDEVHSMKFARDSFIVTEISDLLLYIGRSIYDSEVSKRDSESSAYEALTAYIDTHLDEDLSLGKIADDLYLSKYYISHMFRENTGMTLHSYILMRRLKSAELAMRDGATANEAAAVSGFSDYSGFYRAFRKEYGISPSEYTKRLAGETAAERE